MNFVKCQKMDLYQKLWHILKLMGFFFITPNNINFCIFHLQLKLLFNCLLYSQTCNLFITTEISIFSPYNNTPSKIFKNKKIFLMLCQNKIFLFSMKTHLIILYCKIKIIYFCDLNY
jgi:hypothetical protein